MSESTGFIGRRAELARLSELFEDDARLVTVLGPPGVGKTRLASHWARQSSDGAWICDLRGAADADAMCAAVADALGIALPTGGATAGAIDQLGDALAQRGSVTLVLDNVDGVAASAAARVVLDAWIDAAPELSLVATSRVRTRCAAEVVVDLTPLPPDDAAALFEARARQVRSDMGCLDRDAVRALVERLDGLPLAIELAASRMRVLGAAQILAQLDERFELLADADGASLRAAIAESWDALDDVQRAALAQASVFRGGFDFDAARAVIALPDGAPPILDVLHALCDRSLLLTYEPRDLPGWLRYDMYESIRALAAEHLHDHEVRARHAAHYLTAGQAWADAGELGRLAADRENLTAIHARCAEEGAPDAVAACLCLDPLLAIRGPASLRRSLLEAALSRVDVQDVDRAVLARGLIARADARFRDGDVQASEADLVEADAVAVEAMDLVLMAEVQLATGEHHYESGDRRAAELPFLFALAHARTAGSPLWEGRALMGLARARRHRPVDARNHLTDALRVLPQDRARDIALATMRLGDVNLREDRLREAHQCYERASGAFIALGDARSAAQVLSSLAIIDHEGGVLDEAARRYATAVDILRANGDVVSEATTLMYQGTCHHESGRYDEARECYEDALATFRRARNPLAESQALGHLGALEATVGNIAAAERAFADAEPLVAQANTATNTAAVAVQQGHLDLARARATDDASQAARLRSTVQARLDMASANLTGRSQDLRFALRLLRAAVANEPAPAAAVESACDVLVVGRAGRWFRAPGAERVDLARRGAIRRLVDALAQVRVERPGDALSRDDLLARGWPGERVLPEAGARRVHTALWTLRKLGLADLLVSRDDGYLFDPAVPFQRADA